jgi:tetratricopeptide (TPR) repeat protein
LCEIVRLCVEGADALPARARRPRRAVRRAPGFRERLERRFRLWFALAYAEAARGRLESAIDGYRRAVALRPEHYEAWYNLGTVYVELGRPVQAVEAFRIALARCSDDHEVWNNLGNALVELGRTPEGIRCYEKALDLAPAYHPAWNNLGVALELSGDVVMWSAPARPSREPCVRTRPGRPIL